MQRKLLCAAALASCFTVVSALAGGPEIMVEPDYFSGFFVGATGAFHMSGFDGTSSVFAPQDVVASAVLPLTPPLPPLPVSAIVFPAGTLMNNNISGNSYDGYYGVQGGVGKVFDHRWYTGFVGFGEWGSQSFTANNSAPFSNQLTINNQAFPNQTSNGQYTSSTTVKISNDYGVAFKPGFLVAPKSMVYGKVGAVWADLKVSNSVTGTSTTAELNPVTGVTIVSASGTFSGASSNDDNKIGLLLGVGFEQFIYRDLITFNLEYDYTNYGNVTTSTNITGQGTVSANPGGVNPQNATVALTPVTAQATANARVSTLMGGLNFYFGSHWF